MTSIESESQWWVNWLSIAEADVFGDILGGHSIQEGIYQTLQTWLPTYIYEMNRKLGGDIFRVPQDYRQRPQNMTLPPQNAPIILVEVEGTTGEPKHYATTTRAVYLTHIGCYLYGTTDWQETQALCYGYGAAIRAAIAQHPGLNGVAETTLWMGEKYMEQEHNSTRTTGLFVVDFQVSLANAINTQAGPPDAQYAAAGVPTGPQLLPPPPFPTVETTHVTVEMEEDG